MPHPWTAARETKTKTTLERHLGATRTYLSRCRSLYPLLRGFCELSSQVLTLGRKEEKVLGTKVNVHSPGTRYTEMRGQCIALEALAALEGNTACYVVETCQRSFILSERACPHRYHLEIDPMTTCGSHWAGRPDRSTCWKMKRLNPPRCTWAKGSCWEVRNFPMS